ncbi:SEL1-like repeat protein [Helicobacter cynogastricus]|uniref:SEL1-like repeat protein n=1 Tax=Helicobacter cynogastricus TaxID=329937 RepID=UPI000CF10756|nr:SEL1-like repeat protein [Helicobacter cynogastricus]
MAYLYENGIGVEQDYHKALKLYEKIGKGGYGGGYADMARMYDQGLGVSQDEKRQITTESSAIRVLTFLQKSTIICPMNTTGALIFVVG